MSNAPSTPERWTISDLNLSARITLAVFLISVGIGYVSALVNLHFQEASPGNPQVHWNTPGDFSVVAQCLTYSGLTFFALRWWRIANRRRSPPSQQGAAADC